MVYKPVRQNHAEPSGVTPIDSVVIAMDIGTSGIRAQAVDYATREVYSTAVTTRHPLPGANVIDHLHFALELGVLRAQAILIRAVNRVIEALQVSKAAVRTLAVCGNPTQLSIFCGSEIRDLAYAGRRKRIAVGVDAVERNGCVTAARHFPGLDLAPECSVVVPPAIQHEVGADALAMIIKTGILNKHKTSLAVDFGTNAEMALVHDGRVITASTAAGPALEGQHISCGVLAVPGAICDLAPEPPAFHRVLMLGPEMLPLQGNLIDLGHPKPIASVSSREPIGITGTGTIALIQQGIEHRHIVLPHIKTDQSRLYAAEHIFITETDLHEAGKAVGALRAGQLTLCHEAGIDPRDIDTVYMCGASGTYVDPVKAQKLGMIPATVRRVYQMGNTSLAMARDLATDPSAQKEVCRLALRLRETHCMLAASKFFQQLYILEISYWTEGMPMGMYQKMLGRYGVVNLPSQTVPMKIIPTVKNDIGPLGTLGIRTVSEMGSRIVSKIEGCTACLQCKLECPEDAIAIHAESRPVAVDLNCSRCNGVSCRRCERVCPENVLDLNRIFKAC